MSIAPGIVPIVNFYLFFVCLFVFDCSYSVKAVVSLFLAPLIKKSEAVLCGSV